MITRALFAQRDFTDMSILDDFHTSLEHSLRSQMTGSGLYMGARDTEPGNHDADRSVWYYRY